MTEVQTISIHVFEVWMGAMSKQSLISLSVIAQQTRAAFVVPFVASLSQLGRKGEDNGSLPSAK
jgi:hypothetical protein